MSFSQKVKLEIAAKKVARPCCALAASYGAACFGKYFDDRGMVLHTELLQVARYVKRVYSMSGIQGEIREKQRPSGSVYEFAVQDPAQVKKMLELFECTGRETNLRINARLFSCQGCFQTFVGAAFLCSGTMTDPTKEYNLEFLTNRYNLARDFEALLAEHEFGPHRTCRKGSNIIYVKASETILDLLAFMGAAGATMELMNLKFYKDVRNKANRITNCETANISKVVNANAQTHRAIRYLEEQGDLESLPEPLRQAARLRKENPQASLAQLAALSQPPVSKSGLSHRMKKLESLAAELQKRRADV